MSIVVLVITAALFPITLGRNITWGLSAARVWLIYIGGQGAADWTPLMRHFVVNN